MLYDKMKIFLISICSLCFAWFYCIGIVKSSVQVKLQVELKWRRGGDYGGRASNPISWLRGGFQRVFSSQSSPSPSQSQSRVVTGSALNTVDLNSTTNATTNATTDTADEISLPVEASVRVWVDGDIPLRGSAARQVFRTPLGRLVPIVGTVAASSAMKALAPILGNLLVSDYLSRRKSLMQEKEKEPLNIDGESI